MEAVGAVGKTAKICKGDGRKIRGAAKSFPVVCKVHDHPLAHLRRHAQIPQPQSTKPSGPGRPHTCSSAYHAPGSSSSTAALSVPGTSAFNQTSGAMHVPPHAGRTNRESLRPTEMRMQGLSTHAASDGIQQHPTPNCGSSVGTPSQRAQALRSSKAS